jgi:hypothetical protein
MTDSTITSNRMELLVERLAALVRDPFPAG